MRKILSLIASLLFLIPSTCFAVSYTTCSSNYQVVLHMDDAGLTDSSSHANTMTAVNLATTANGQGVQGSNVALGGGDNYYEYTSAVGLGSGDFAMGARINLAFNNIGQTFIAEHAAAPNNGFIFYYDGGGNLTFAYSLAGLTYLSVAVAWTPTANTWYNIEVDRNNSNFYFFAGPAGGTMTQIGATQTITGTLYLPSANLTFGAHGSGSFGLNGYMDEAFLYTGGFLHTSGFTADNLGLCNVASSTPSNSLIMGEF